MPGTPPDQHLRGILSGSAGLKRLDKLPATKIHAALRASPEPKAGMLWLHFEQIHRIAIFTTVSVGRSRALPIYDFVLHVQKIAVRHAVMDNTLTSVAGIDHPILISSKLAKRHLGMVFVAERMNSGCQCCTRHEITSST